MKGLRGLPSVSAGASVSARRSRTPSRFVVGLDPARKQVIVGPREALLTRRLTLREVNWLGDIPLAGVPAEGQDVLAKVRSTRPPVPARLFVEAGAVEVELANGEEGVSPGQACVFYGMEDEGSRVLGGGWIAKAVNPALETSQVAENMAQDAAAR